MVQPLGHNPQTQPITVALKNICRDYPAGGGVLRELLQNADDAGASSVKFVLDQTSYPTATLVDPKLADYQGPSLLAYNDSTFSDKDFDSLSRIGDSRKLQDGTTTGRFGRGFNAVYNWTDSPSILSRDRLLILDPHHWWTKRFEGDAGGPIYDFVEHFKDGAMDDQMAAFSAITTEFDRSFPGTIIRIPLRNSEQTEKSKICGLEATFSEVALVLQTFSHDFGHTGLLFMKNISQITVVVGDSSPIKICISNDEQVRRHKSEINAKIRETILAGGSNFNSSFEVKIESGIPGNERQYRFAIHHSIQNYPEDEDLASWSKDEALLPWVAVASEIGGSAGETIGGSLFNVLPSQIRINQPIYIHSCFSMSSDRAWLHKVGDGSIQCPLPGLWNQWLFDVLIPTAWANLLIYLAKQYPNQSAFEMWPNYQKDKNEVSYGIDEKVLRIVAQNNYPIWYTNLGYVTLRSGLVSKDKGSLDLQTALNEARVPVIYLADDLLSRVETICKVVYLKPGTVCEYLEREPEQLRMVGEIEKQVLLEYVISDPEFRKYGALKLFPFEDGTYKAIDTQAAFIHRDDDEHLLFKFEKSSNIDLQKLSKYTILVLQKGCSTSSLHPSLRQRSAYDLKTYCLQNHFKTFDVLADIISVDENVRSFISGIWDWILARQYSILNDNISCLWLLPLTDGRYRKIKPIDASVDTIYAAPGELGDFLRNFANIAAASNKPILQANSLSSSSLQILLDAIKKDLGLSIKSSDRIEDFMLWLGEIREVFDGATDNDRSSLHKLLALRLSTCKDSNTVSDVLASLKVFQKVVWRAENDYMVPSQTWVALKGYSGLVGLREINPVPDLGDVTFLNAKSDDVERVLSYFGLAKCPSALELLERFVIPFWEEKTMPKNWTTSGKEKLTELLLRDFYNLEEDSRKRISSSALIPVKRLDGASTDKFLMAKELIDPSKVKLRKLFFEDEEACPVNWALEKYYGILINCGLITAVDNALVLQRVKIIAQRSADVKETSKRARCLLQSSPSWATGPDEGETLTLRELQWLPVTDLDGSRTFKNAKECRGQDDKLLVGHVLPLLDFEILQDWRNHLGWNQPIQTTTILNQLEFGIEEGDRKIVDAVLKYINKTVQVEGVREELMKLSCVLASHGQFVSAQKAFQHGCKRLQPYFFSVDTEFWREHKVLLKSLGVLEKPNLEDLLTIQDQLPSEDPLNEEEIPIAIEIIRLASISSENDLSRFKILDETGRLRATADVVYNDCSWLTVTGKFNSIHPDIPKSVINAFQIEALSARVEKCELGIEDTDDDEYDQHEDVATAISDTLTRYTVESTFKEFLANADDCKSATELNWLLDETQYPKDHLLTDELKDFQGPALLVHNDGVFVKDDFEGFRLVGRGSKRDDASTIGKFGRGSQTMYHWTDVPMLLSGEFLLILDPLRQVLPRSSRTHGRKRDRKRGVRIPLSRLRGAHRNQLAPFEGLWGFSQDLEYYDGTIFRFPLRQHGAQSKLMETGTPLDFEAASKCLENFLEREGRISLLFLRRIQFMDFKIFGDKEPRWSIQSDKDWSFSGWTKCTITRRLNQKLIGTCKERWRVAIEDLKKDCVELPSRHKRMMKNVECGMAVLVPEPELKQTPIFKKPPIPKYFSTLPLPFSTELPVHIHATFLLASDRASMPVEDSMQEDGAKWNRWLLSCAIPRLYLAFLEDLGRETRWVPDSFPFWPQDSPPKGHLSERVYTSFWQMLPDSSRGIFPVTRQIKAAQLGERGPPELVKLDDAIFDFLSAEKSSALREILETQFPTLVKPPGKVKRELQRVAEVESVTPERLRKLFKEAGASQCLEEAKDPMVLESVLDLIKPEREKDFMELNGCHVLPLADGTLGTLTLANAPKKVTRYYFVATEEELGLFDFALHRLVSHEPGKEFKKAIMDSKKFNITQLSLSDIGELLKSQKFGDKTPTAKMDAWLRKFWEYCCRTEALQLDKKPSFASSPDIRSHPIFKAVCNGISSYIEPERLDKLPAVIEPDTPIQRDLCKKFPGIYMFSMAYLPQIYKTTENSLNAKASFARFVTTISKLAEKESGDLEAYVKKHLGTDEIEILQKLVVKYGYTDKLSGDHNMKYLLRALPIWPTVEPKTWINASAALVTRNNDLLVPWMNGYHLFISNEIFVSSLSTLKALGVIEVDGIGLLSAHILPNLPNELRQADVGRYQSFIRAISQTSSWRNLLGTLRESRLAPSRAKKLRATCELFDHEDAVFKATFRNEENEVFLLKELEQHRNFWVEIGLRHRDSGNGQFVPEDYTLCLTKMRNRLEACKGQASYQAAVADAQIVLVPLTTASTALGRLSKMHWSTIVDQATFPATTAPDGQPLHRRQTMAEVSKNMPLLRLSDIVGSQYMSVCWTQISFPASEPTVTSLAQISSKGKPSTSMAWKHLAQMAGSIEALTEGSVKAFLSDIFDTYDYLQENLEDSKDSFAPFRRRNLWFNLEHTDTGLARKADLGLSRGSIENLILESSCDMPNLKSVRQGLIRYQKLLRELGCKSIVYPSVETPQTHAQQFISASLSRLREEGILLDLTLEAKVGSVQAHKVIMASASGFFARQFKKHWSNHDTIDLKPFSHSTLSTVVDFSYVEVFDWTSMQLQDRDKDEMEVIANKLDDLLDLLDAANYFDMPALKAQAENQILILAKLFIREHNVLGVLKRVASAKAAQVEGYCKKFYAKNREAVDLATEE